MKPVFINAIGIAAPGLDGWDTARAVLCGEQSWVHAELPNFSPTLLPPNERRRASRAVRLAFRVAEEAMSMGNANAGHLASVFASSDADTWILDRLCTALAQDAPVVSPTDFHNSVHNAAPGYWHIATRSRAPSTSLSAFDASFTAGLLEAVTQVHAEDIDCLFATYDLQPPPMLGACRAIGEPAGVALLLSAESTDRSLAKVEIECDDARESLLSDSNLERLRLGNPALRALPLLESIARQRSDRISLKAPGGGALSVRVSPC